MVSGSCPPSFRCKGSRVQQQREVLKIKCLFSEADSVLKLAEFLQGQVKDQKSVTSFSKTTPILVETLKRASLRHCTDLHCKTVRARQGLFQLHRGTSS